MITLEKLKIYLRYKGDVDMFGRAGRESEKAVMSDIDFNLIQTLLQDANVLDGDLGSGQRSAEAMDNLQSSCSSDEVVDQIRQLAEKL